MDLDICDDVYATELFRLEEVVTSLLLLESSGTETFCIMLVLWWKDTYMCRVARVLDREAFIHLLRILDEDYEYFAFFLL